MAQLVKNPPETQETWIWSLVGKIPWRRERLPTPVFWPGDFHEPYSPWGHKGSDMTEWLSLSLHRNPTLNKHIENKSMIEIWHFNICPIKDEIPSQRASQQATSVQQKHLKCMTDYLWMVRLSIIFFLLFILVYVVNISPKLSLLGVKALS